MKKFAAMGNLELWYSTISEQDILNSVSARALALAHAKSGDAAMISGYVGNSDELDEAMSRFGVAYADQTEKDYNKLAAAAKSGRIKVAGAE